MTVAVGAGPAVVWPPEATSRGTVVLIPGRGEHPGVYQRLGRRLAFDGYTVVGTDPPAGGPDAGPDAGPAPAELAALFAEHPVGTRVLLGSDSGGLAAWRAVREAGVTVDALVLAGLPLDAVGAVDTAAVGDREAELAARTSCPVHSALLKADPAFGWGALSGDTGPVPDALPEVPTLLLHGEADAVAPVAPVRRLATGRDAVTLAVVADGVHDVLNDRFHRSVAARLVLFLEEVGKAAVIRDEASRDEAIRDEPDTATGPAAERPLRARRAAPLHVSARLDYALRAIGELAGSGTEPVRCESIARARGIPLNSLVNLMIELRRAGLVRSQRGCEGGYWLARPAAEITVAQVVRSVEGELVSLHSDGPGSWLWHRLGHTVAEFLEGWTVGDVVRGPVAGPVGSDRTAVPTPPAGAQQEVAR